MEETLKAGRNKLRLVSEGIIKIFFGAWNGIQVFVYPTLILYMLDSVSLVYWFSNLLTIKQYHLPLSLFLLILFYMGFLIVKFYSFSLERRDPDLRRKDLVRFLLELHKGLLLILFVAIMIFVLSSFLSYFYQIQVPQKRIYAHLFQYISLTLMMFYYIQSVWTKPFKNRRISYSRCIDYMIIFARKNIATVLKFTGFIALVIFSSVKLYHLMFTYAVNPAVSFVSSALGIDLRLKLIDAGSSIDIFYNVMMIVISFFISNLLFYPIVALGQYLINRFHPIKLKVANAETKTQDS